MSANGKTILNFLSKNYDFVLHLFRSSKQNNFAIKSEVLTEYCLDYDVKISDLKELKIVREHSNSEYSLYHEYKQFLEFIFDDFRPVLDESIKIYKDLIVRYYQQLIETKEHNKVNELINSLINEIEKFSIRIENNTKQLLAETRDLKANSQQFDYIKKIQLASNWIETYIKPLNDVLDKKHPNSVTNEISRLSDYASRQRYEYPRFEIRQQFNTLYNRILSINNDILINSAIIAKDLTPLIERIRSESYILTGVITFLENFRKNEKVSYLPIFEESYKHTLYSEDFRENAKFLFEQIQEKPVFILNPIEIENTDFWFFDLDTKNDYKKRLVNDLPIDNFFDWCFNTLQKDTEKLNSERFFTVSSLLFIDEEFERDFNIKIQAIFKKERTEILLSDVILDVPIIELKTVN